MGIAIYLALFAGYHANLRIKFFHSCNVTKIPHIIAVYLRRLLVKSLKGPKHYTQMLRNEAALSNLDIHQLTIAEFVLDHRQIMPYMMFIDQAGSAKSHFQEKFTFEYFCAEEQYMQNEDYLLSNENLDEEQQQDEPPSTYRSKHSTKSTQSNNNSNLSEKT